MLSSPTAAILPLVAELVETGRSAYMRSTGHMSSTLRDDLGSVPNNTMCTGTAQLHKTCSLAIMSGELLIHSLSKSSEVMAAQDVT